MHNKKQIARLKLKRQKHGLSPFATLQQESSAPVEQGKSLPVKPKKSSTKKQDNIVAPVKDRQQGKEQKKALSSSASSAKSKSKKKIWIACAIAAAVLVVVVCSVVYFVNSNNSTGQTSDSAQVLTDSNSAKTQEYKLSDDQMIVDIGKRIEFYDGSKNPADIVFRNASSNSVDQKLIITLDGQTLFENNGYVEPGYEIPRISLNKNLDPGFYRAKAEVVGYDRQTHEKLGSSKSDILLVVH